MNVARNAAFAAGFPVRHAPGWLQPAFRLWIADVATGIMVMNDEIGRV